MENPYDHGLASLDLALILLEIFKALKIDREALGSFILFREAARNRALTTEMIERLRKEIAKARTSPGPRGKA